MLIKIVPLVLLTISKGELIYFLNYIGKKHLLLHEKNHFTNYYKE